MQTQNQKHTDLPESILNFKQLYYQERQRRIQIENELQVQRVRSKKLAQTIGKIKANNYCSACYSKITSPKQKDGTLIEQLKGFSEKLSSIVLASSAQCFEPGPSNLSSNSTIKKSDVGMIQNISIFGINQTVICGSTIDAKMGQIEGEIMYSMKQKNDIEMQASRLVFPSGMTIKKYVSHKAKDKTIQLMSYCYTNLKSFVLNFECPNTEFDEHFHSNELLNHVNPEHRLFCICIGINDYTWVQNCNNKFNISLGVIEGSSNSIENNEDFKIQSEGHRPSQSKQSHKQTNGQQNISDLQIRITQRVFCIMTYYPFFSFFEDILKNLINIVKMERLAIYKHNQQNIKLTIKQSDSKFQISRMIELFQLCYKDMQHKKLHFNKQYELRLINQHKITLTTYWDDAKVYFTKQWIYSILSMFTFDTFLDLFTLIMLEDRVVFICQNSYILTYTIFLFSHVLTKPLKYSFPIVSIIPSQDQDFLNAPFPVLYGMLKKRKSLQDKKILQNYDNTYVFLSPDKVQIVYQQDRKQVLNNKSTKLLGMKQLKEVFKQLKKTRKKQQKTAKYDVQSSQYCILASNEQKIKGLKIVSLINQFVHDEIVSKLPSQVKLQNMKKKIDVDNMAGEKDEHSYLMSIISAQIKKTVKDPFITAFLNTQMINNFMFK